MKFRAIRDADFLEAVDKHTTTEAFWPSPSQIMELVNKLHRQRFERENEKRMRKALTGAAANAADWVRAALHVFTEEGDYPKAMRIMLHYVREDLDPDLTAWQRAKYQQLREEFPDTIPIPEDVREKLGLGPKLITGAMPGEE